MTTAGSGAQRKLATAISALIFPAFAVAAALEPEELLNMSLEELGQLNVISVSRQPQALVDSPSAIQVITREDIRRSGATSIPEALRLATNLQVAQSNSQEWIITARGFSSDVGNKLLVMIDGRTVYTPLFSGVFWDRQDYLLADIERIEVVSGPGSALWGTNAVNGVINIITRSSADTQGLYVEAGGGSQLHQDTSIRYGGRLGLDTNFRVYAKRFIRDGTISRAGRRVTDDWDKSQAGFRIDTLPSANSNLTLQGDIYSTDAGVATGGRSATDGVNVLGRWRQRFSATSDAVLQMYYDRTRLTLPTPAMVVNNFPLAGAGVFRDDLETFDIDFQHNLVLGERNNLVWGIDYRRTDDEVTNSPGLAFFPTHLQQNLYSIFVQDEIALIPQQLTLTLGAKFEHNDYTGWENAPSARVQWHLADDQTLWASVSRAVRMPSRIDRDFSQPAPDQPPLRLVLLSGGRDFQSETVLAWEAGYRMQFSDRFLASVALFYNDYDHLRSTNVSPLIFPLYFDNDLEADTHGIEFNGSYQVNDWWRLTGGYNLLLQDVRVKSGGYDFNNALNETADPRHQVSLRSSMNLFDDIELDATLRWVDDLVKNNGGQADEVPGYAELNMRLGWTPGDKLELSLIGQNLLDKRHPEFGITEAAREEIERSVYAKVVWRY